MSHPLHTTHSAIRPLAIRNLISDRVLEIDWTDGTTGHIRHSVLRESCRCGHCVATRRHGTMLRAPSDICVVAIEPYGSNTLRLGFDDGHQRGLYPFQYLRGLVDKADPVPR